MIKLSEAQQRVVDLMRDGWELGSSTAGSSGWRWWLQKGGCGKGGACVSVHGNTAHALCERTVITVRKHGFPTTRWRLVAESKWTGRK